MVYKTIKINKTLTTFYSESFTLTFSCENYSSFLLEKDVQTHTQNAQTFAVVRLKSCHFF